MTIQAPRLKHCSVRLPDIAGLDVDEYDLLSAVSKESRH
jgi:hypothetical protein